MGDLSRDFSRWEFKCKGHDCCYESSPVDKDLVTGLQELRDKVGKIFNLSCGFRCKKHNKEVGGADKSYHPLGMAADIKTPEGMTRDELAEIAETIPLFKNGGIGIYLWGIHVDVRGYKARW